MPRRVLRDGVDASEGLTDRVDRVTIAYRGVPFCSFGDLPMIYRER